MLGSLIGVWIFVLLWSWVGWLPLINRFMSPPPLEITFYVGLGLIALYLFWPLIRGMRTTTAPPGTTSTGGATAGGAFASFGRWLGLNLIATPLFFGSLLVTTYIAWPTLYNFLVFYQPIVILGMTLASFVLFLLPSGDVRFKVATGNALVVVGAVVICFLFQTMLGAKYYHGTLRNGSIHIRPFDMSISPGDKIRVRIFRGFLTFPKVLVDPSAKPDEFIRVDAKGHSVETREPFGITSNQPRPTGELLVIYDKNPYIEIGQKGEGEFDVTTGEPLEFTFNIEDDILDDPRTKGNIWVAIYINPQLTPGGWAEASVKRFKATLGALVFVVLALLAIGLIWYYVDSPLGKKAAVIFAIVAISIVGWGIWGTRDVQKKQEFKKEWRQKAQQAVDDPFTSPPEKLRMHRALKSGKEPAPPASSFEHAWRVVNLNTSMFKVLAGIFLGLAVLAGFKRLAS